MVNPRPLTIKMEKFAQNVVALGDLSAAYRSAYSADGMSSKSIGREASRLADHPLVEARIEALQAAAATAAGVTRQVVLAALLNEAPDRDSQPGARVRALELLGKALESGSMFTDRVLVGDDTLSETELEHQLTVVRKTLDEIEIYDDDERSAA